MKKIITVILVSSLFFISGCMNKNDSVVINDENSVKASTLVKNTAWIASDESEVIFTDEEINWYRYQNDHSDNYYSGKYVLYVGKDAVKYITQELSYYGVTKMKLNDLFDRSDLYSVENFVVFDIRYDEFMIDGESSVPQRQLVPWYGFILEDNTYLDVVNMNTGTYYKFSKR